MITIMEKAAIPAYSPVAGGWYPAIEYPYPKVYHKFLNKKTFDEIYPDLVNDEDEETDKDKDVVVENTEQEIVDTDEDLSGNEEIQAK